MSLTTKEQKSDVFSDPKTLSVFDVLTEERMEKTLVVLLPKHDQSKNQVWRVSIIPPHQQIPDPPADALRLLNNIKDLTKPGIEYPKSIFRLPPMKLLSSRAKIAGLGEGQTPDVTQFVHKFFFVATTEGLTEEFMATFGGKEQLEQKQMEAYRLLMSYPRVLERKRFFHPLFLKPEEKQELFDNMRELKKDATEQDALEAEYNRRIKKHAEVKIPGNFAQTTNTTNKHLGIYATSKAWYRPAKKPTPDENVRAVQEYEALAARPAPHGYAIDEKFKSTLMQGLRHRRVSVFGRKGRDFVPVPNPKDPNKLMTKAGDFVLADLEYDMYDLTSGRGGGYKVSQITVVVQGTAGFARNFEVAPEYDDVGEFINPYEETTSKRTREDEGDQASKQQKTDEYGF